MMVGEKEVVVKVKEEDGRIVASWMGGLKLRRIKEPRQLRGARDDEEAVRRVWVEMVGAWLGWMQGPGMSVR